MKNEQNNTQTGTQDNSQTGTQDLTLEMTHTAVKLASARLADGTFGWVVTKFCDEGEVLDANFTHWGLLATSAGTLERLLGLSQNELKDQTETQLNRAYMTETGFGVDDVQDTLQQMRDRCDCEDEDKCTRRMTDSEARQFLVEQCGRIDERTRDFGVPSGFEKIEELLDESLPECGQSETPGTQDETDQSNESEEARVLAEILPFESSEHYQARISRTKGAAQRLCAVCSKPGNPSEMINRQDYYEPAKTHYFHPACYTEENLESKGLAIV